MVAADHWLSTRNPLAGDLIEPWRVFATVCVGSIGGTLSLWNSGQTNLDIAAGIDLDRVLIVVTRRRIVIRCNKLFISRASGLVVGEVEAAGTFHVAFVRQ